MNNYFRATVYHPAKDLSAIIDCYGKYDKLWKFTTMLSDKRFNLIAFAKADNFTLGNIPAVKQDTEHIFVRACCQGQVQKHGNTITINGMSYQSN